MRSRSWTASLAAITCAAIAALVWTGSDLRSAGPRFFDDDPISREPASQDASKAVSRDVDLFVDLMLNLFTHPGAPDTNARAGNVNTVDEVPDSSWFTNRIGTRPVSVEEAARGPIEGPPPAPGKWTITGAKSAGASPGFTAKDSNGQTWFVSFDQPGYPEADSAAVVIANKIFWTLGYWQVENFIVRLRPDDLVIADDVKVKLLPSGQSRQMRRSDLDEVLRRSNRSADGSSRAVAARQVPGRVIGPFKYFGTRNDDPNDIVPHEDRRELRALKVFGAWTNLSDLKAGNTLDTIVTENGRGVVRHYLQDVGSTFGTGTVDVLQWADGWNYFYDGGLLMKRLVSLGFYLEPWQTAHYKEYPSVGRFEGDAFDPLTWKPHAPTAAFLRARSDDNFWAARRVGAFSDELIRALVATGELSDRAAADYLATVLIKRRDKILRAYLPAVNPLVDFSLTDTALTFTNAAVAAHVADDPPGYEATWSRFDNATGEATTLGTPTTGSADRVSVPRDLPRAAGTFVKVQVRAVRPAIAAWSVPIDVYFKRTSDSWRLVGLDRLPTAPAASKP
jgi:hypothetical protein